MFAPRSSLKTRILFLIGSVVVVLMLLISSVLLLQWRSNIMKKQTESAVAVSRTFAVTVIDAMIFEEKSVIQKEDLLSTYVENFIARLGTVRYVALFDANGAPILTRVQDAAMPGSVESGRVFSAMLDEGTIIRRDPQFGWILEADLALVSSGKVWGTAVIGFDAQSIRNEIQEVFFILLFATVVITSVVLLILFYSIQYLTSSLETLVQQIDKIDFISNVDVTLPVQNDEIGFLFSRFELMVDRLEYSKKELEQAQKQIYQAEKLASIGRLASGVAHQVNNPLNGIKSCLYAIQQEPFNAVQAKNYLDLINEGITSIETVVKKLLGFARQRSISEDVVDINESIMQVIRLFDLRLREKNIEITASLAEVICAVRIDTHLIQEVIMNLLLNSYDAVENGGAITITTGIDDQECVFIRIRDTGSGIQQADLKKIFDPFFTTKAEGTGTGLGLSVCLGIIESHGGHITVHSIPEMETNFTITLPQAPSHEITHH